MQGTPPIFFASTVMRENITALILRRYQAAII